MELIVEYSQQQWEFMRINGNKWYTGALYVNMLAVMVFMLLFNVSSLPLMFSVLYVLGIFCP
jgi:hypothetical protein